MLKKMRWRFIGAAMAAFITVILLISLAVNLWNYNVTSTQQDNMLSMLMDFDIKKQPPFSGGGPQQPFGHFSGEIRYMTRFFTVHCAPDGSVRQVDQDYIAAVSEEEAASYANAVLKRSGDRGYYKDFRYMKRQSTYETTIIFLNSEREVQALYSLAAITLAVAAGSIAAVFLLVLLLSKRAIAPYARNIEMQKRFITDASHELKTPLTAIATSADVLALDNEDNEWVQNIQAQSKRLSKLIANLVMLSRLDEEQPLPEKVDFSLSDALWEIAEPFASVASAGGIEYEQHIEEGLVYNGDMASIQQMASILLDNAIKYTDRGGKIRLDVFQSQRKKVITVYNTCGEIPSADLERLFDRFYRPDSSRSSSTGGTGIGLSIAKATAEAHGGSITVSGGKGDVTFKVVL